MKALHRNYTLNSTAAKSVQFLSIKFGFGSTTLSLHDCMGALLISVFHHSDQIKVEMHCWHGTNNLLMLAQPHKGLFSCHRVHIRACLVQSFCAIHISARKIHHGDSSCGTHL